TCPAFTRTTLLIPLHGRPHCDGPAPFGGGKNSQLSLGHVCGCWTTPLTSNANPARPAGAASYLADPSPMRPPEEFAPVPEDAEVATPLLLADPPLPPVELCPSLPPPLPEAVEPLPDAPAPPLPADEPSPLPLSPEASPTPVAAPHAAT